MNHKDQKITNTIRNAFERFDNDVAAITSLGNGVLKRIVLYSKETAPSAFLGNISENYSEIASLELKQRASLKK